MRPQRYLVLLTFLLATLSAVSGQTPTDSVRFDPPPGSYPQSIDVSVSKSSEDAASSRLWYRFAEDRDTSFIAAGGPIPLSAIPGGTLDYTIELAAGEPGRQEIVAQAQYRLDAEVPPPPVPDPVPGVYKGAVDLKLRSEEGASVRYLFARSASEPQRYSGALRLNAPPGERSEYTVIAVAEDAAGNLSEVFEGRYVVDGTGVSEGEVELQIRSPVSGEFANRQLLLVESSGLSGIHYSTDGSSPYALDGESQPSPSSSSTSYAGPALIEKTGRYTVTVAGLDARGAVHERSVTVTAGGEELLTLAQGVFAEDRQVPAPDATAYFTTDERTPTRADRRLSEAIRLNPSAGVVRTVVLRVLIPEGSEASAGEYRYVYVLEGRTPAQPEAIVHRSPGTDSPLHVSLLSSPGAVIVYTLDGSDPARGRPYRGGFAPSVPRGQEEGSLKLRALARYSGTVESEALVLDIPYDTAAPPTPSVETIGRGRGRQVTLRIDGGGEGELVYTLGDRASRWSHPLDGDRLTLSAPEGSDRTLQVSVARLDESGNLSSTSEPVEVRLDGKAPPPPEVSVEGRRVSLEGEKVRFRLKADTVNTGFESYEAPIFLSAPPNGRMVYDLRAFSQDEHGNASELIQRRVVADTRTPRLPENLGVKDGASYGSAVTIREASREPDLQLRYRVSFSDDEESPPEDPGTPSDQQVVGGGLTLDAPENTERRYRLAIQPVFTSSGRSGEVSRLEVTVDRRPPEVPEVLGVVDGETYGHSVSFRVEAADEGDRPEYVLVAADGAAAEEPDTRLEWRDASDEVRVDVPIGEEKRFTLRARSVDPAGNVTEREEAVKFRIDRAAPSPPEIRVEGARAIGAEGVVNRDGSNSAGDSSPAPRSPTRFVGGERVRVILTSEEASIHYRLRDETQSNSPGNGVPEEDLVSSRDTRYDAPIVLETEEGAERSYLLRAISVDSVGNESAPSREVRILADRRAPPKPELVSLHTDDSGRGGTAVWRHEQGSSIRYRVAHESVSGGAYRSAERIGRWELPSGATRGEIEFFAEDVAGNRSELDAVAVRGFSAAPEPRLAGVEDGGVYGEAVVIQNRTATGTVRYEVTTDGSTPGEVSRFSSALPESIPFDVAPGETVTYRVAARTFADESRPSPVTSYSFTVDRAAPSAPEIVGIQDGDFLTEDVTVEFEDTVNTIRYSVVEAPEQRSDEPSFEVFDEPITLNARPGVVAHYRVTAYSIDPAGNRSDGIKTWDVFLGKEIVYVSPNGSQEGDGTLGQPVADLSRAVELARRDNKRTIFVAQGSYVIDAPLVLDASLTIQGGFDSESWRRSEGSRSTLELRAEAFANGDAVAVQRGKLTVGRFNIETAKPAGSRPAYAISLQDSTAFLQGVAFALSGTGLIRQEGGDLTLKDAEVREESGAPSSLFHVDSGRMVLDEVRINAAVRTSDAPVIRVDRAQVLMQGGSLIPGGGTQSLGIVASSSRIVLASSEISAGTGSRSARALETRGGSLTITDTALTLDGNSRIASAVVTDATTLRIEESSFDLRGTSGATAVTAQGGSVRIGRTSFAGRDVAAGYIHFVVLRSSSADLVGNVFVAENAGELLATRLSDSRIRFVNNTVLARRVNGAAFGINASGGSTVLVQNSLFAKEGTGRGRAMYAADAESQFTLRTNSFAGWEVLYERSTGGFSQARQAETASLGGLNGGAGLSGFEGSGNVVGSSVSQLEMSTSILRLTADAVEIDAGSPPPDDLPYRNVDIEGQQRPAPRAPRAPRADEGTFDIGADEFYR